MGIIFSVDFWGEVVGLRFTLCISGSFLKVNVQNADIYLGC